MLRRAVPLLALATFCALLTTFCRISRVDDAPPAGCSESPAVQSRAQAATAALVRERVETSPVSAPAVQARVNPNWFDDDLNRPSRLDLASKVWIEVAGVQPIRDYMVRVLSGDALAAGFAHEFAWGAGESSGAGFAGRLEILKGQGYLIESTPKTREFRSAR